MENKKNFISGVERRRAVKFFTECGGDCRCRCCLSVELLLIVASRPLLRFRVLLWVITGLVVM